MKRVRSKAAAIYDKKGDLSLAFCEAAFAVKGSEATAELAREISDDDRVLDAAFDAITAADIDILMHAYAVERNAQRAGDLLGVHVPVSGLAADTTFRLRCVRGPPPD